MIQQQLIPPYNTDTTTNIWHDTPNITPVFLWYSKLLCHYTHTATASYYVTIPLLIQQTIMLRYPYRFNNLIRLYTPIATASYYVNILLLIQQTIMLIYSYWYNNLIHYYNSIDTASYYVPILLLIQIYMPQPKQQTMIWYSEYQKYCMIIHE